jgi:beta-lactamase class A
VETPHEYFDILQQVEAAASWIKPYRKVDTRFDRSLAQDIQPLVNAFPGLAGIAIKNLSTGQAVFVNANESFEAGGLWRLLLMLAAMEEMERGRLEPDDVFEGRQGSVTDALESVLGDAGREAEAALAARVGLDRVQNLARSLGMTDTIIASGGMKTTPTDVLALLEGMASQGTPEEALFREPALSGLPEGLPPFTPVAHEAATLPQAIHDAGVVYTSRGAYAVVVMTERVPDEATASDFISAVSRLTYSHFALSGGDGPTGPYWDFNFQMSSANFSFAGAY